MTWATHSSRRCEMCGWVLEGIRDGCWFRPGAAPAGMNAPHAPLAAAGGAVRAGRVPILPNAVHAQPAARRARKGMWPRSSLSRSGISRPLQPPAVAPATTPAGFVDWVEVQLARARMGMPAAAPLLLPDEAAALEPVAAGHLRLPPAAAGVAGGGGGGEGPAGRQLEPQRAAELLGWALGGDSWLHVARLEAALRGPLLRLAAHYLLRERRRWAGSGSLHVARNWRALAAWRGCSATRSSRAVLVMPIPLHCAAAGVWPSTLWPNSTCAAAQPFTSSTGAQTCRPRGCAARRASW